MKKNKLVFALALLSAIGATAVACSTEEKSDPKIDITYRVEYYVENVNGEYTLSEELSYTETALSGTVATALDKTPVNFELNEEKSNLSATLNSNSVVLKVYYDQNAVQYSVNYYIKNEDDFVLDSNLSYTAKGLVGETVIAYDKTPLGYMISDDSVTQAIITNEGAVLNIYYEKQVFEYKVEYYKEQDGEFVIDEELSYSQTAKSGETVIAQDKIPNGFRLVDSISDSSLIINKNGLTLKIYYAQSEFSYEVNYYAFNGSEYVLDEERSYKSNALKGSLVTEQAQIPNGYIIDGALSNLSAVINGSDVKICIYYMQQEYKLAISADDIFERNIWDESYGAGIQNYTATLKMDENEIPVIITESGDIQANLLQKGEYTLTISHASFKNNGSVNITVNDNGEVEYEVISKLSDFRVNVGGTVLDYNPTYDIYYNTGSDRSSLSYITSSPVSSFVVTATLLAKHEGNYLSSTWSANDNELSAGFAFINTTGGKIYIGLCGNKIMLQAGNYSPVFVTCSDSLDYFASKTMNTQNVSSVLTVAKTESGKIFVYKNDKLEVSIDANGYLNGTGTVIAGWKSVVRDNLTLALSTYESVDYKEFAFKDIDYTTSNSVINAMEKTSLSFDCIDAKISCPTSTTVGKELSITATANEGKILSSVLLNGENYLPFTNEGNVAKFNTVLSPLSSIKSNTYLDFEYIDANLCKEISGNIVLMNGVISDIDGAQIFFTSTKNITYKAVCNADGVYKILLPKDTYFVYAKTADGSLLSRQQSVQVDSNADLDLDVGYQNVNNINFGSYDQYVKKIEGINGFTFNGKINAQRLYDLYTFNGNFAFGADMIQARNNPESVFSTNDYVSGFIINVNGQYMGVYVNGSSMRLLPGMSWSNRVEFALPYSVYTDSKEDTIHNLQLLSMDGKLYFAIDYKIAFYLDRNGVFDALGNEYEGVLAYNNGIVGSFDVIKNYMTAFANSSSYKVGMGSGANITSGNFHNYDRTGYVNIFASQSDEYIKSAIDERKKVTVISDEHCLVNIVGDNYDFASGSIKAGESVRIVLRVDAGYTLASVKINGVSKYLNDYISSYATNIVITDDTRIEVQTTQSTLRTISGKVSDKNADITVYSGSAVYKTTPNDDGSFSFVIENEDGAMKIIYPDLSVRNIDISGIDDLELGEVIAPVSSDWAVEEMSIEASMDVVQSSDDKYMFVIGTCERTKDKKGHFYVYSVEEDKVVAKLSDNLGNCRQIAYENGYCYVSARNDGMWVIDVNDPVNPKVIYHYDSVEMATGIIVHDNTVFIANRQYGVEVVDVTNPAKPKFITTIQTGEVQSLDVCNNMLFAGIWGEKSVLVLDIRNVNDVKKLYSIPLDGRGDGVFIEDGILFAATGHHSRGVEGTHEAPGPAFGMGNGIEAYKVDESGYKKLFNIKFDKGYQTGFDLWEAVKAGNYLYVANTFNGTYIYDITDIESPSLVDHLKCTGGNPNNATGLSVIDGSLFVTGGMGGLFRYNNPDIKAPTPNSVRRGELPVIQRGDEIIDETYGNLSYDVIKSEGQIRSVVATEKYLITANGTSGIYVYDRITNELLHVIETGYAVKEVTVDGDYLYTAEGFGGIAVYEMASLTTAVAPYVRYDSEQLGKTEYVQKSHYVYMNIAQSNALSVTNNTISATHLEINELRISPTNAYGKRYMLLHAGGQWCYLADITDIKNVKVVYKFMIGPGLMYSRNLSSDLIDGRYFAISGNSFGIAYLDIGIENPTIITEYYHDAYRGEGSSRIGIINNGLCNVTSNGKDYIVLTVGHGYRLLAKENSSIYENSLFGTDVTGWPIIYGDIMVVSERMTGKIALYDISQITDPKAIAKFTSNTSPDIACVYGDKAYVPLGNYGLMVVDLNKGE